MILASLFVVWLRFNMSFVVLIVFCLVCVLLSVFSTERGLSLGSFLSRISMTPVISVLIVSRAQNLAHTSVTSIY